MQPIKLLPSFFSSGAQPVEARVERVRYSQAGFGNYSKITIAVRDYNLIYPMYDTITTSYKSLTDTALVTKRFGFGSNSIRSTANIYDLLTYDQPFVDYKRYVIPNFTLSTTSNTFYFGVTFPGTATYTTDLNTKALAFNYNGFSADSNIGTNSGQLLSAVWAGSSFINGTTYYFMTIPQNSYALGIDAYGIPTWKDSTYSFVTLHGLPAFVNTFNIDYLTNSFKWTADVNSNTPRAIYYDNVLSRIRVYSHDEKVAYTVGGLSADSCILCNHIVDRTQPSTSPQYTAFSYDLISNKIYVNTTLMGGYIYEYDISNAMSYINLPSGVIKNDGSTSAGYRCGGSLITRSGSGSDANMLFSPIIIGGGGMQSLPHIPMYLSSFSGTDLQISPAGAFTISFDASGVALFSTRLDNGYSSKSMANMQFIRYDEFNSEYDDAPENYSIIANVIPSGDGAFILFYAVKGSNDSMNINYYTSAPIGQAPNSSVILIDALRLQTSDFIKNVTITHATVHVDSDTGPILWSDIDTILANPNDITLGLVLENSAGEMFNYIVSPGYGYGTAALEMKVNQTAPTSLSTIDTIDNLATVSIPGGNIIVNRIPAVVASIGDTMQQTVLPSYTQYSISQYTDMQTNYSSIAPYVTISDKTGFASYLNGITTASDAYSGFQQTTIL